MCLSETACRLPSGISSSQQKLAAAEAAAAAVANACKQNVAPEAAELYRLTTDSRETRPAALQDCHVGVQRVQLYQSRLVRTDAHIQRLAGRYHGGGALAPDGAEKGYRAAHACGCGTPVMDAARTAIRRHGLRPNLRAL